MNLDRQIRVKKFLFVLAIILALSLRLAGIKWGLPNIFNGDEPHFLNLAVSFGRGSLRPYAFKYPTLWPYFLFLCYGIYFLIWSGFGLLHGVSAFAGLYGWHPTGFYLIARLSAAAFSLLAVWVLFQTGKEIEEFSWAWVFAAFSPLLIYSAHEAKADSLMFFFICLGWHYAVKFFKSGERKDHFWSAVFWGLAFSSQFTALPVLSGLVILDIISPKNTPKVWALEAVAVFLLAFVLGSPYSVLDFHNFWFWIHMHSPAAMNSLRFWTRGEVAKHIAFNLLGFEGFNFMAGFLALLGISYLFYYDLKMAFFLISPILISFAILVNNPDGGVPRYLTAIFPALDFMASAGIFFLLKQKNRLGEFLVAILIGAFVLLSGIHKAWERDEFMRLPDTRMLAENWISKNIPQGSVVLADEPDTEPRLFMLRQELLALAERAKKNGSPRSRLYLAMANASPGGGYWVYRIKRSAWDLDIFFTGEVKLSQEDWPMLDVSKGIKAAKKAGVQYVITSSQGVNLKRAIELRKFFDQLNFQAVLLKEFDPVAGKIAGPVLKIYQLSDAPNGVPLRNQPHLF